MSDPSAQGVLLIGHGTRGDRGTQQFFRLGRRLSERLAPMPVEAAVLEFQQPTISQAWQSLVARGVNHVHVAPLLLFAAGHAKQDIPEIISQCHASTPHVSFDQSRPLSRHPAIVELVVQRLQESLRRISAGSRIAVVMVGRGSHDPCAAADMRVMTGVIGRRFAAVRFHSAFYAMASPTVPDVIDWIASDGRADAIIVHPHLLFAGRLYQAIKNQMQEAGNRYPGIEFLISDYLGPDAKVADAIAARCGADYLSMSITASATNRSGY